MTKTFELIENKNLCHDIAKHWIQIDAEDTDQIEKVEQQYGLDFKAAGNKVWETDTFIYLPFTVERREGDTVSREKLVFALSDTLLVTIQPSVPFDLFDKGVVRMRRLPSLGTSSHAIMCSLLWALNESCERVVNFMSDVLDAMAEDIYDASIGQDKSGRALSEAETQEVVIGLNECEKVLSRVQESQLQLERTTRHLHSEVLDNEDIKNHVDLLLSDLQLVKDHAGFEQDKIRFLQDSIKTALGQKQNGIVKVFTIITAVFLPPTLIGTFYGMNFTNMPELTTEHGYLITTILTFLAALLPLLYIKKNGWLR